MEELNFKLRSDFLETLKEIKFVCNIGYVLKLTKLLDCSYTDPLYMFTVKVFVRGIACILVVIVFLATYILLLCVAILKRLPYLIFAVSIFSTSIRVIKGIAENKNIRRSIFVRFVGWTLHLISQNALFIGMHYTCEPVSRILAKTLKLSIVGLNVNHGVILPYMTFYGVIIYFMFRGYSSYVNGYVELREIAFDTCEDILEGESCDHRIRQVAYRDEEGVIRISEKLLEHICKEMKPLKENIQRMLLMMAIYCVLSIMLYEFIENTSRSKTRVPPLVQVIVILTVGVFPKLYDACKTGPADKKNLKHSRKKTMVEKIITAFAKEKVNRQDIAQV